MLGITIWHKSILASIWGPTNPHIDVYLYLLPTIVVGCGSLVLKDRGNLFFFIQGECVIINYPEVFSSILNNLNIKLMDGEVVLKINCLQNFGMNN